MEQPNQNPVVFQITIPWREVAAEYQKRVEAVAAETEIPGFRKGKAPTETIEERIGKKNLVSDTVQIVLPPAYQKEITSRNLKPFIAPKVKALKLDENSDWVFEITVIVKPEVKVDDLDNKLKAKFAAAAKTSDKSSLTKDYKMRLAFDALLESARVDLPQILIDEEVNLRLSQLVDQLQKLGLTVEQYLSSKNLTADGLKLEYQKTAQDSLKLNLALDKVAQEQKFTDKDRIAKAVDWLASI